MTNEEKKQWYTALYGCYFERVDEYGNKEVIDPTMIRRVETFEVDQSKVIRKEPLMIYEHKSKPEPN